MFRATRLMLNAALLIAALPSPATAGKYLPVQGYTAGAGGSDKVYTVAVAPTPDGGYVALTTRDDGSTGASFLVVKVSAAGQKVWEADLKPSMTAPNGLVRPNDLAVHSSGRVFITGQVSGAGSTSLFVAELSADGTYTGASFEYDPSDAMGWTLALYGDILYVGGEINGNGYLSRFNVSSGRVQNWETQAGLNSPVLGIAAVSGEVFASYRDTTFFSNSSGWMNKYTDNGGSVSGVVWTTTGGGRAHISPDGYVYVAGSRPTSESNNPTGGSNAHIAVVNPATGAMTMFEAGLPLQAQNSSGDCCAYVGGIADFGFTTDGTMVVAYLGVGGISSAVTSGLAGYGRSAVSCGGSGSDCISWQFKWTQSSLAPYFAGGNAELRSLGVSGALVVVGANTINCVDADQECSNRYGIVVLDNALEVNPPMKGEMQVRRNVIRVDRGDQAVVVLKGEPYGNVTLCVYGPSGNVVAAMHGDDCKPAPGEACDIQLDADGNGAVTFDGKYDDTTTLRSGMYWIVASGGGIAARKPVIVRSK